MIDLATALLSAVVATSPAGVNPASFSSAELALGGIRILDDATTVTATKGPPLRQEQTGSDFIPVRLTYADLVVELGGGKVRGISSQSSHSCTPAGICTGTALSLVQSKYGPPRVRAHSAGTIWEYGIASDWCWLRLTVDRGKVDSLAVLCAP